MDQQKISKLWDEKSSGKDTPLAACVTHTHSDQAEQIICIKTIEEDGSEKIVCYSRKLETDEWSEIEYVGQCKI